MKKLILITIFVLLGTLVNSAMAAKPVREAPLVTLTAGPIDNWTTCKVANHTDQAIEVFMNICIAPTDNSGPIECWDIGPFGSGDPAPIATLLAPGHYEPSGIISKPAGLTSTTCEITYSGDPGDITGMMCGTVATNFTCFQMQPR